MTEHPVSRTMLPHLFVLVTGAYLLSLAQVSGFTRNVVERMSSTIVCLGPNYRFSGYPQVKRGLGWLTREEYAVGAEEPGLAGSRGWLPVRRNGRGRKNERPHSQKRKMLYRRVGVTRRTRKAQGQVDRSRGNWQARGRNEVAPSAD